METQILRPKRNILSIKGKLSYSEGIHAWNIIRFKKEIITEFPQLKEKLSQFSYNLVFYQEYDELETAVKRLKRNGEAMPILLWLSKEKIAN